MKNKKTIALAMSAISTMGAVAPVFAAEIIGTVVDDFNLDNLKSTDDKVRVQAEKDLEVTKAAIEKLVNEVDTNGNKVYKVTKTEDSVIKYGQRYSYVYVNFTSKDDVTNTVKHQFTFYKKTKSVQDTDQNFGQDIPWNTENKIEFNFKENYVTVYNEETGAVDKKVANDSKGVYAKLSKAIYELKKASANITILEEQENGVNGYTVYTNNTGDDREDLDKVARIDIIGDIDKTLITFVDMTNDFLGHWAEDTIVDSMIAEIVDNTNKFNPEQQVTRAQFAKMICKAKGIKPIEYNQDNKKEFDKFTDVSVTEWYAGYVAAISKEGIMNGDGNKTFRPEDKISRQEVAVVLATLECNGKSPESVTTDVNGNRVHKDTKTNFVDDSEIAIWADESVEHLRNKGFAKGYEVSEGKFEYRPVNNMSRAEALTMITRVVQ